MRVINPLGIFIAGAIFLIGCQAPPAATGPTERMVRIADKPAFIDSMLTLLREHDLPPRFVDRAAGLLETEPTTGGQWFEIWRSDVHGGYQILESSLHTIRRSVAVSLSPVSDDADADAPGDYWLSVEARTERLAAPERPITTASGALGIYSESTPTIEGTRGPGARSRHWVALDRDVQLESYLLDRFAAFTSVTAPRRAVEPIAPASASRSKPTAGRPQPGADSAARQSPPGSRPAPSERQQPQQSTVVVESVD
jgi:hypothetical protein